MGNILIIAILLFLFVVIAGGIILTVVANRKWGYTPEREKELEELPIEQKNGRKQ